MSTLYLQIPLHEDPVTKAKYKVEIHFFNPVHSIMKIQTALILAFYQLLKKGGAGWPAFKKLS